MPRFCRTSHHCARAGAMHYDCRLCPLQEIFSCCGIACIQYCTFTPYVHRVWGALGQKYSCRAFT